MTSSTAERHYAAAPAIESAIRTAPPGQVAPPPPRIDLDPDDVRNGLGRLVLTLVELIRELMERQAIRRMEAGSLTAEETERLGITFMRLSEEMERLKVHFGLEDDDLNIDLGPLGKLL
jgi:hypothetical protein